VLDFANAYKSYTLDDAEVEDMDNNELLMVDFTTEIFTYRRCWRSVRRRWSHGC
jgi:hypothetical protein